MIIIETCPVCGHDLQDLIICTNPPIPRKECHNCGWNWESSQQIEDVVRVLFSGNHGLSPCISCPNHPNNGGSGICLCTLGLPEITC